MNGARVAIALILQLGLLCSYAQESTVVRVKKNNRAKTWGDEKTVLFEHLNGFKPQAIELSKYGGRMDRQEKATGFFYAKKADNGWILIDPEGYHYFSIGVNSVSPNDTVADHRMPLPRRSQTTLTGQKRRMIFWLKI